MMERLLEVRESVRYIVGLLEDEKGKKRKRTAEERAADEARYQDLTRRLQEVIARRKAWLLEQRRSPG